MNVQSKPAPTRPDKGEQSNKSDTILDAALSLFAERGFHGTAVPLVAEKAQVGAGTIYRYFPSKEALVNALYKRSKSELVHALLTGLPSSAPAREQFRFLWNRAFEFATTHAETFRFLELHHHAPYIDDTSRAHEASELAPLHALFASMREQQIVKPLPERLLVALIWGAFVGTIKAGWEGQYELSPALLEQAEQCCWESIRR
jgi:AcrR family transcriptional regulator